MRKQESLKNRKFIKKTDILLFLGILLIGLSVLLIFSALPYGETVIIEHDGEVIFEGKLGAQDESFELEGSGGIILGVDIAEHHASVTHASCPDQICVRTGSISKPGETIICLPAKISITVRGSTEADAVTF